MKVLITGGCGFVGSSLAKLWKEENLNNDVTVFDNLKRRGSELNLPILKKMGIDFIHGDIRCSTDLDAIEKKFDLIIEASAEPSVHAGMYGSSPRYLIDTNLNGTINCLEFGRVNCGGMIFLSTSRVYPINPLKELQLEEGKSRLELSKQHVFPGLTSRGISENFPVFGHGFRSLYGTTKLASELICEEYVANYNFPVVINRCGVIAGPGQFGKTDQGVFTLWVAKHFFGGSLSYTGFGGKGMQVRDILHPVDLFDLIKKQSNKIEELKGEIFSVGGGLKGSVSLWEYTEICQKVIGNKIEIIPRPETSLVDLPWIVMDNSKAKDILKWEPIIEPSQIISEIGAWLKGDQENLKNLFN